MGGLLARPANPANIAMASEFVKAAIAKDKVVIFSKSYCPFCTMAKEVRFSFSQKLNPQEIGSVVAVIIIIVAEHTLIRFSFHFTAIQKVESSIHGHRIGKP